VEIGGAGGWWRGLGGESNALLGQELGRIWENRCRPFSHPLQHPVLPMLLIYDKNDLPTAKKLHDERLKWLQELGATELADVGPEDSGFLFGYAQGIDQLHQQVGKLPNVHDRPEERDELLRLDVVLERMDQNGIVVPTPKTWILQIDDPPPTDLEFPLFVRTPTTSWQRGGEQAKVKNLKELNDEVELLRRAFGWDAPVLLRQWLDVAVAGKWMFGKAPQEIRTWVVDGTPLAWSFHYLHAVPKPTGFPPSADDLEQLAEMAAKIAALISISLNRRRFCT
jgi:hypothetical protein